MEKTNVIATRVLQRSDTGGTVCIELTRPQRVSDGEFYCEFHIAGLDALPTSGGASGVDEFQSIILAIKKIGTMIYTSHAAKAGTLIWLEQGRGYGFLLPQSLGDLYQGDDPP